MDNESKRTKSSVKNNISEKLEWFTVERCIEGMPGVAVLQVILGLLLYIIASIEWSFWLGAMVAALILGFIGNYKGDNRKTRILLRVVFIAFIAALFVFDIVALCISIMYSEYDYRVDLVFLLSFSLSAMLFAQAAASSMVKFRRKFDLVLLRVIGIIVLAMSLMFCTFGLGYKVDSGTPLVLRSFTTPEIFGMSFEVAIDNIITRLLFSLLSVAFVFMSFKIRAVSSKKGQGQPEEGKAE